MSEDFGFEEYLKEKGMSSDGDCLSNRGSNEGLNSDEFLQILISKNIDFEVIDTYYTPLLSEVRSEFINDVKNIEGVQYIKTSEVTAKNSIPQKDNKNRKIVTSDDVRVRQIKKGKYSFIADDLDGLYSKIKRTSVIVAIGHFYPALGVFLSFADNFRVPEVEIGNVTLIVRNHCFETYVWHEVYDYNGYVPMVIVESRKTDVEFNCTMYNQVTGQYYNDTDFCIGVLYEYGMNYNKLTQNINEAVGRYNAGLRDPEIYKYYTGEVFYDKHKLPHKY